MKVFFKTIIFLLFTFSRTSQADEMNVFCYSANTDSWEWVMADSGNYLSFYGYKTISYNDSGDRYFYYVSIDESLYTHFVELCPAGSVPQPAYSRFTNWSVFNVQKKNGDSFFAGGRKDMYNLSGNIIPRMSDRALKKNIRNIYSPISSIKKIQGVKYEMKVSGETELGFIAQNIQQVYPEMVIKDPESDYLMVDYRAMIPVLLEAIKELEIRISELEIR